MQGLLAVFGVVALLAGGIALWVARPGTALNTWLRAHETAEAHYPILLLVLLAFGIGGIVEIFK